MFDYQDTAIVHHGHGAIWNDNNSEMTMSFYWFWVAGTGIDSIISLSLWQYQYDLDPNEFDITIDNWSNEKLKKCSLFLSMMNWLNLHYLSIAVV